MRIGFIGLGTMGQRNRIQTLRGIQHIHQAVLHLDIELLHEALELHVEAQ